MTRRRTWSYASPLPHTELTQRDLEVLAAVLMGTRREAATRLGISESTVRGHMSNICVRLQVRDRVGAAHALGWLRIPPGLLERASWTDQRVGMTVRRVP